MQRLAEHYVLCHAPGKQAGLGYMHKARLEQTLMGTKQKVYVPEGRGGGGGEGGVRSVLDLPGAVAIGPGRSLIPYSVDSLESVRGNDEPREVLGESLLRVLEL